MENSSTILIRKDENNSYLLDESIKNDADYYQTYKGENQRTHEKITAHLYTDNISIHKESAQRFLKYQSSLNEKYFIRMIDFFQINEGEFWIITEPYNKPEAPTLPNQKDKWEQTLFRVLYELYINQLIFENIDISNFALDCHKRLKVVAITNLKIQNEDLNEQLISHFHFIGEILSLIWMNQKYIKRGSQMDKQELLEKLQSKEDNTAKNNERVDLLNELIFYKSAWKWENLFSCSYIRNFKIPFFLEKVGHLFLEHMIPSTYIHHNPINLSEPFLYQSLQKVFTNSKINMKNKIKCKCGFEIMKKTLFHEIGRRNIFYGQVSCINCKENINDLLLEEFPVELIQNRIPGFDTHYFKNMQKFEVPERNEEQKDESHKEREIVEEKKVVSHFSKASSEFTISEKNEVSFNLERFEALKIKNLLHKFEEIAEIENYSWTFNSIKNCTIIGGGIVKKKNQYSKKACAIYCSCMISKWSLSKNWSYLRKSKINHTFFSLSQPIGNDDYSSFSFGGESEKGEYLTDCDEFNFRNHKWEQFPNLKNPKSRACCCQFNKSLYIFGGLCLGNPIPERINLEYRNIWKEQPISLKDHILSVDSIGGLSYQIDSSFIIFFGLQTQEHSKSEKSVHLINIDENFDWKVQLTNKFIYHFERSDYIEFNNHLYFFPKDSLDNTIMELDINSKEFLLYSISSST